MLKTADVAKKGDVRVKKTSRRPVRYYYKLNKLIRNSKKNGYQVKYHIIDKKRSVRQMLKF